MAGIDNFSGLDLAHLPSVQGGAGVVRAPLVVATAASLAGMAELVSADISTVDPVIVPWPVRGKRPLVPGTGIEGGVAAGHFAMTREGGVLYAENHAVGRRYVTGWYDDPPGASDASEPASLAAVYTHEANHHPDGGQIFVARDRRPFVALLAPPTDDVRPEHFIAFWCDGSQGLHLLPEVWHQPVFPIFDGDRVAQVFDDKQGRVHACVSVDFVGEYGVYVQVPLVRP